MVEPEKKTFDINSTLLQSGSDNYVKMLYNNQGIIIKIGDMYESYPSGYVNEILIL